MQRLKKINNLQNKLKIIIILPCTLYTRFELSNVINNKLPTISQTSTSSANPGNP